MNVNDYALWTAVVTPFNADDSIDFASFEKLLRQQESAKNGVVLLGSTGEGLALNLNEKKSVVEFATNLNLSIPLLVGVPGFNLPEALDWVNYCNQKNIHGYLMVAPLYAKPGKKGQEEWFKALMDKSTKPCMLYNVPSRTGIKLSVEALKNLSHHPRFWSVKEASGSISEFEAYTSELPKQRFYCGDDALLPYFAYSGATGLVSVASNVWPKETHHYVKLCMEKKTEGLFPLWQQACNSLFIASNPVPAKALLALKGVLKNAKLRAPLTLDDLKETTLIEKMDKDITSWGKNAKL